jgi:hypothetical protein
MDWQALIVAAAVAGCTGYAVWTLLPGAARRALVSALLKFPWPQPLARRLAGAAKPTSHCGGCGGCDSAGTPPGSQRVRWHPPPR